MREVGGDNSTSVSILVASESGGISNNGTGWALREGAVDWQGNSILGGAMTPFETHGYIEIVVHEPLALNACSDLSWAADPQTVADTSQYGIYYDPPGPSRILVTTQNIELEVLKTGSDTDGNGMRHPRTHLSFKRADDSEYFCQVSETNLLRCSDAREFSIDQTSVSSWSGPTYSWNSSLFATDDSGGPD